jgi:hypothetical protein
VDDSFGRFAGACAILAGAGSLVYAVLFLIAALLVVLFFGDVFDSVPVILVAGGLTAVFVTPAWWIWTGRTLLASPAG